MSESSAKTSIKKGFKAPVLNTLESAGKSTKSDPSKAELPKADKRESNFGGKENGLVDKELQKLKKKQEKKKDLNESEPPPKKEKRKKKEQAESKDPGESETTLKGKKIKKNQHETEDGVKIKVSPKKIQNKTEEGVKIKVSPKKENKFKKPEVSLTDSQYEEIFRAVLRQSTSQHNTPIEELLEAVSNASQKSSVKGGQKEPVGESEESVKTSLSLKDRALSLPELSPWGSHLSKQNSQASTILKELQASQVSSLLSPQPTSSSSSSSNEDTDGDGDGVLSQRSMRQSSQRSHADTRRAQTTRRPRARKVDKRHVLEELQGLRIVGLWVYCDRMTCQKQRFLPHVTDPQELPDIWYCHMNPDSRYNSCSCEEQQISAEEEEDMIDNQYTCGSVVWAQVVGFPWWPAMVDDDPDLECYYWLEEDMRTVTFYHVVFFDKNEVTRAWIPLNKIVPFKKNLNTFKQWVVRGIDFSHRLQVARDQAKEAASMTVVQRLKKFSFIARYKGPIFDDQSQIEKTKKKYKLKCSIGKKESVKRGRKRRVNANEAKLTPFENLVESNKGKQRRLSERSVVGKPLSVNDETCSNDDLKLSKVGDNELNKGSETLIPVSSEANVSTMETHNSNKSPEIEKQKTDMNPESTVGKLTKEREVPCESETSSGICVNSEANPAGEPAENASEKDEAKPPSVSGSNVSQKSKVLSSKTERVTEDTLGSVVEPSQAVECPRADDQDSQHNKLSQSTIADFLATESEDAVVPEAFSQQSEPFEE